LAFPHEGEGEPDLGIAFPGGEEFGDVGGETLARIEREQPRGAEGDEDEEDKEGRTDSHRK
jgi:hypothetical protein